MASLFKRKTMSEKLEAALASLRSRADALSARHAVAETQLTQAKEALRRHLLEGDLDADAKAGEKLEATVATATAKVTGLADAITEMQRMVTDAEQKIRNEKEAVERQQAAAKLDAQIAAVESALPEFLTAARTLADALTAIGHLSFETGAMSHYVGNSANEVEVAAAVSLAELRGMVDAIRIGSAPIPREPMIAPPIEVIPPPPTQVLFMLRSAKYHDHDGSTRYAAQYQDCEMPVEVAQRALRYNVAVPLTDGRRRHLLGARGGVHVNPNAVDLADLTSEEAARPRHLEPTMASDPVLREANFTLIDRGAEAQVLQIPVQRT